MLNCPLYCMVCIIHDFIGKLELHLLSLDTLFIDNNLLAQWSIKTKCAPIGFQNGEGTKL